MYTQKNAQPHKNAELSATRNSANPTTCFWAEPCHDQGPLTMSSREIADLTDKRHDNVMHVCRGLRDSGVCPEIQETPWTNPQNGQTYLECLLNKRDSLVLIARLSPEFTAKVVDRWQELEAQQPAPAQLTRMDILKLAMASEQARIEAEAQLAQAAPMVEFVARYVQAESGSMGLRQVCKVLKAKQPDLTAFLLDRGLMYRTPSGVLTPKAEHIHNRRFEAKTGTAEHGDSSHAYVHYKFTAKGLEWIARLWDQHQAAQEAAED